jgi:hypothetical protein
MKANVKFNSYIGTSAADISDSINLKQLLTESGYDGNRFEPIGVDLVIEFGNSSVFVVCIDKLNGNASEPSVVKCLLKTSDSLQINKMFTGLNVTLINSHTSLSDNALQNCKSIYIEDNGSEKQNVELNLEIESDK